MTTKTRVAHKSHQSFSRRRRRCVDYPYFRPALLFVVLQDSHIHEKTDRSTVRLRLRLYRVYVYVCMCLCVHI